MSKTKRQLYENMCGFCEQKSVESIGTIRVCEKHLDLVNEISTAAKTARADRVKKTTITHKEGHTT